MSEFIIEMRAVSTIQKTRRRRHLPLRLLREVVWNATNPLRQQIDEAGIVPEDRREEVVELLHDLEAALLAYRRGGLGAADFLETQHSVVTALGLKLAPNVKKKDSFPTLVEKLPLRAELKTELLKLNRVRRGTKHHDQRQTAGEFVWRGFAAVDRVVDKMTGAWVDAVSAEAREIEKNPQAVFRSPPMFWRSGEPRVARR